MQFLDMILQQLVNNGFTVNPLKCKWGVQEIQENINKDKAKEKDKKKAAEKAVGEEEKNTRKAEQGEARGDSSKVRRIPRKRQHVTM